MAVDGSHVGGSLPTHSGRPGGTFESWFYVRGDHEHERKKTESQYQPDQNTKTRRRAE
jgi:hypothetical protein